AAQAGPGNKVIVRRTSSTEVRRTAAIASDGSFSVPMPLVQNARNVFQVTVQDPSGNLSAPISVVIVEDSTAPQVSVDGPTGAISAGRNVAVQWQTVERHRGWASIRYQIRSSNKMVWIARRTADDGRHAWSVPASLRGQEVRVVIAVHDRLHPQRGHKTVVYGPWVPVR
ncbi:MAG: Ig-like domain-containing protein, partial [Actinomycetota bacterium]|nr:Ig-like domain-containing protein [Actinomycetota bacterium]